MLGAILTVCLFAASPSLDDRLAVLRTHLERLRAIEVAADARHQATAAIDELAALLAAGASTGNQIDGIYKRMDEVRTWLLANASEKPSTVEGEFFETSTHWGVRNKSLTLTILKQDLTMSVETDGGVWCWGLLYPSAIAGGSARLFLLSALACGILPAILDELRTVRAAEHILVETTRALLVRPLAATAIGIAVVILIAVGVPA